MSEKKLGPSEFQAEIERLEAEGKLPTLDEVLNVVAEARQKYLPKILEARAARTPGMLSVSELGKKTLQDVQQMSEAEKAKLREHLDCAFKK